MSQHTIPIRPVPQSSGPGGSAKLLWIAIALGVLAVLANMAYIQIIKQQTREQVFTIYTFVRPIKAGRTIQKDDLREIKLPESVKQGLIDAGVVPDENLSNRLGRETLQQDVAQGELLTYRLFQNASGRRVDDQITRDKRWISLPINGRTVPGALRVGMYVDIEAPFNTGGAYPRIMPVMERIQIQSLGTTTIADPEGLDRPGRNFQTITIEVTPEEATQLATIQRVITGDFELQPRNPNDEKLVKIPNGGINPDVINLLDKITRENPTAGSNRNNN